ncbi:hypothetical protein EHS13_32980 [Paenibacillus psychroresistens]|uniref:Uncharacterized protein n=1 Tax=Paenibacillus psychroresistens TaxID=1778678 RepID=A0A6B8RVQ6_9BACL|nr:hypothetical protein [Paenibacillus psychroresistens]QGQ99336.1 hypothetical protein EHS13_32980 [Paenibacillus psychroresistens]
MSILVSACTGEKTVGDLPLIKETEHGQFYSPDSNADKRQAISMLAEALEANYMRITNLFQYESANKTLVHVYTDKAEFQQMIGRDTEGTYVASENIINVYAPASLYIQWKTDLQKA